MFTRKKAKELAAAEVDNEEENSDSDSIDTTIVEMNSDIDQAQTQPQITIANEQLSHLLTTLNTLRQSVEELRKETQLSQIEIQQLRARVDQGAASVVCNESSFHESTQSPPPRMSTQHPQPPLQSQPPLHSLPPNTSTPYNGVMTFVDNSAAKLYPLPPFDGNPEDWPLFLANFRDTTNEFHYNNRQNLMRLHKALHGNAKSAVTSLLIYPDDVAKVMQELEFNFGRSDLLIRSQLQKVQQFPPIYENRLEQVLEFSNRVRNIVAFFKSAKCDHHLANPTLLEQLIGKLPPTKQYEWSRHASNIKPYATVESFAEWVSELAGVVSLMPSVAGLSMRLHQPAPPPHQGVQQGNTTNRQSTSRGAVPRRVLHSTEPPAQSQKLSCVKCSQSHKLSACHQFKALSVNNKWALIKRNRLCFACMQKGHNLLSCQSKQECGVNGCTRLHHRLLHQATMPSDPSPPLPQDPEHVLNCRQHNQSSLFKILPVVLSGPRGSMSVFAMYDEGSSVSLLEDNIANQLGLKGPSVPLTLQWYGEKQSTEPSKKVTLNVRAENSSNENSIRNVRTVEQLNLPTQTFIKENHIHLKDVPIASYRDAKPVLLLGLDNSFLGVSDATVAAGPDQPIAAATKLGWVVYGPLQSSSTATPRVLHVKEAATLTQLNKLVEEYFSVESFGVRSTSTVLESEENARANKILLDTTRNIGQRYEVGLLWRDDNTQLPQSYAMAKQRLLNIEAKMSRDTKYAASYNAEVYKYIDKGYAKLLPQEAADRHGPRTWYLPHFGVVNPHKPNKLRIVFDAAAATSNTSLNSTLLKGPEHAQPLLTIMHKFRQGTVAVAGDIQEMFSQVRIRAEDQDSQRFLWRDGNPDNPIRVYKMVSMIFGAVCSPCCAEYIKNINATKFLPHMPGGAKATIDSTYVDDLVISFDNVENAEKVMFEALKINAAAGFTLRSFVSNCKELQFKLNGNQVEQQDIINAELQPTTEKVLGMFWNSVEDKFEFHFKFHRIPRQVLEHKRAPTKRELLGVVMAIYDPFGLLANITIFAKILLQSMWKRQIQWDEPLPLELEKQWVAWWKVFQGVKNFSVARCLSSLLPVADDIQLHVFVDASISAFTAVAYLRVRKASDVEVTFIAAKSRCAPAKGMTVPRLELQAAVLGCRLRTSIVNCHDFNINSTTFWSDSKTVLLWLRSTTRKYKQFVGYRIAEILASSTPAQWRWIPTSMNVADDATRAKLPKHVELDSRWITGPDFLRHEDLHWPREPDQLYSEHCVSEEAAHQVLHMTNTNNILDSVFKFSSYHKTLRVTAWLFRFVRNVKTKSRQLGELTAAEVSDAEKFVCRLIQEETYAAEISALRANKKVSKSSHIFKLTPLLDADGLLRVNGRIDAAYCLPESARKPIILPEKHYVTQLVMDHYHQKRHHQNDCLTINEMRQKFWVPHARTVLKALKRKCVICITACAQPSVPLMGQLPPDRLTPYVRPFSYTGVDYCGPFLIAVGRRREKRWVALFTCLTTRGIHLEVAEDLSTDAFLICFRNFVNRRGMPIRIRSDNGTNFIGAQKELQQENRLFDVDRVQQEMTKENIEWVFNCPANPSAGGCWERLVQCVKRLLQRTLKDEVPRLETFRCTLIEAENIINSRPLTELPIAHDEEEPLTPNHFLSGCLNSTQTPGPPEEKICLRKQWKIAQNLKDRLWKRWVVEYLPQLLHRQKWRSESSPLQIDQLVIICDSALPRSQWEKGRITEVYTAKDGQVRSAAVRTSHGILRRPASKLAALSFVDPSKDPPGGGMSLNK